MSSDTPLNKVTKENGSHVVTWKFVEKKSSEAQITSKSNSEGEKTCFFTEKEEGRNQISCHRISEKVCQADQIYHA